MAGERTAVVCNIKSDFCSKVVVLKVYRLMASFAFKDLAAFTISLTWNTAVSARGVLDSLQVHAATHLQGAAPL